MNLFKIFRRLTRDVDEPPWTLRVSSSSAQWLPLNVNQVADSLTAAHFFIGLKVQWGRQKIIATRNNFPRECEDEPSVQWLCFNKFYLYKTNKIICIFVQPDHFTVAYKSAINLCIIIKNNMRIWTVRRNGLINP